MNKRRQVAKYLIFDFLAAALSWTLFYVYRKEVIEPKRFGIDIPLEFTSKFFISLLIIGFFWIILYYITGYYKNIYRRSRLLELGKTFLTSISGVVIIFFTLILDDYIESYKNYYSLFFTLFILHFVITFTFRLILSSQTIRRIHKREMGFNTLIVGNNEKALKIYRDMSTQVRPEGNIFTGFISVDNNSHDLLSAYIPRLGGLSEITAIIGKYKIEEIIIAIETNQHEKLSELLTVIESLDITVWGLPDLYDFLSGTVKITAIYSSPLMKISNGLMSGWQENLKRIVDILGSIVAVIIFSPVFLVLAIIIRVTSKGPVVYSHERIGKYGIPFTIYKLRSMVANAETNGPELSSTEDSRITKIGKFLRRTHLDEIPQFYNVLIGDMSLVGPRPERKYYIEQIVKKAPHYTLLHKIRPGITSWGQVKYGYASNVEEMLERLPYDMIYLKNMSLYVDLKILIYTLIACYKGKGK
jgi:exopolysaccharide biosynthesis polyprenyl glycosylphosphotransferase